jgi:hypothetical protein
MKPLADDGTVLIDDDRAHTRVGVTDGSARRELQGAAHQPNVTIALCRAALTVGHVLPFALDSCSGELRGANGEFGHDKRNGNRGLNNPSVHALSDSR